MIEYIIKSSLSLILLFGFFWFILRQEKLFNFNRFFLIFSLAFSLIIPFISIPVKLKDYDAKKNIITALNNDLTIFINNQNSNSNSNIKYQPNTEVTTSTEKSSLGISYRKILLILYVSGVILLLTRFLWNIFSISHQAHISEKVIYARHKFVLIDNQVNPFCFCNTVFVSKQDYLDNRIAKELLIHEIEHINQSHSVDIIFIELIQIIYWFNPVLILYNRAIRANHEFLADNGVIQASPDIRSYANKLISFLSCSRNIPLTSGFNQSLTKKRLIMLTKPESSKINNSLRILLASLFVSAFFLTLSCFPSNSQPRTSDKPSDGIKEKYSTIFQLMRGCNLSSQVISDMLDKQVDITQGRKYIHQEDINLSPSELDKLKAGVTYVEFVPSEKEIADAIVLINKINSIRPLILKTDSICMHAIKFYSGREKEYQPTIKIRKHTNYNVMDKDYDEIQKIDNEIRQKLGMSLINFLVQNDNEVRLDVAQDSIFIYQFFPAL